MSKGAVISSLAARMGISTISAGKSLRIVNIREQYHGRVDRSLLCRMRQNCRGDHAPYPWEAHPIVHRPRLAAGIILRVQINVPLRDLGQPCSWGHGFQFCHCRRQFSHVAGIQFSAHDEIYLEPGSGCFDACSRNSLVSLPPYFSLYSLRHTSQQK